MLHTRLLRKIFNNAVTFFCYITWNVGWLTNTSLEKRGRNKPLWPHMSQAYYPGVFTLPQQQLNLLFF